MVTHLNSNGGSCVCGHNNSHLTQCAQGWPLASLFHAYLAFSPLLQLLGGSWWEAAPQSSTPLNVDRVRIATWNFKALRAHISEALAANMDLIALQEIRADSHAVTGIARCCKLQGYNLCWSALPQYAPGSRKIDQDIPGVAFLVRDSLTFRTLQVPGLEAWTKAGRSLAIEVWMDHSWVKIFNVYAPVHNGQPMLDDLTTSLASFAGTKAVLLGDINQNSRLGAFADSLQHLGWQNLTANTEESFISYKHTNGCSCIDVVAVTDRLATDMAHPSYYHG